MSSPLPPSTIYDTIDDSPTTAFSRVLGPTTVFLTLGRGSGERIDEGDVLISFGSRLLLNAGGWLRLNSGDALLLAHQ